MGLVIYVVLWVVMPYRPVDSSSVEPPLLRPPAV